MIDSGIYHTASGSTYEIDAEKKILRRSIRGQISKSDRAGNGEWKEFTEANIINGSINIIWRFDETSEGLVARMTITNQLIDPEINA